VVQAERKSDVEAQLETAKMERTSLEARLQDQLTENQGQWSEKQSSLDHQVEALNNQVEKLTQDLVDRELQCTLLQQQVKDQQLYCNDLSSRLVAAVQQPVAVDQSPKPDSGVILRLQEQLKVATEERAKAVVALADAQEELKNLMCSFEERLEQPRQSQEEQYEQQTRQREDQVQLVLHNLQEREKEANEALCKYESVLSKARKTEKLNKNLAARATLLQSRLTRIESGAHAAH